MKSPHADKASTWDCDTIRDLASLADTLNNSYGFFIISNKPANAAAFQRHFSVVVSASSPIIISLRIQPDHFNKREIAKILNPPQLVTVWQLLGSHRRRFLLRH